MKKKILKADLQEEYDEVEALLEAGWILDPSIHNGQPFSLDAGMVWILVLYESEGEKPKLEETEKKGDFDDVVSLKDVPNAEVDALLEQGYKIQSIFAKNTIMLKRKMIETAVTNV